MSEALFAVDPGTTESAIISWDGQSVGMASILSNEILLKTLQSSTNLLGGRVIAFEMIASYGMPVGKETFETVLWIGRMQQVALDAGAIVHLVYRRDVKLHLCGQSRAKDANVSQALKDRFGEKGTKSAQGVTYKLHSHLWQAFALAVFTFDTQSK